MTESTTIAVCEFAITHVQPTTEDFETPYLLTPKVKRGAQANFRLLHIKPKPSMLFPIGDKPMSAWEQPSWWVREISPSIIQPA